MLDITKSEDGYNIEIAFNMPKDSQKQIVDDALLIKIKNHPKDTVEVKCYGRVHTDESKSKKTAK